MLFVTEHQDGEHSAAQNLLDVCVCGRDYTRRVQHNGNNYFIRMRDMKKYIETLAILMALFCACSCSKESAEPTDKGSEKQPSAIGKIPLTFSVGTSKTVLNPSTGAINFNEVDKISIFDGDAKNNEFTNTTPGNNQPSVNFHGEVTKEADTYYALYPYQENAEFSEGTITNVSLPASQIATMNSFDPKANISVGATSSSNLVLMNVCSLLKIVVEPGESYSEAVITSNDGTAMCGTISISFDDDGNPVIGDNITDVSSSVTLSGAMGSDEAQTVYYAVVLPKTYTKGFTVRLYKDGVAAAMKYTSSSVTIERAKIGNFGHIEASRLPGVFTVNSERKKVQFARGNVYTPDNNATYLFESLQYDYHTYKSPSGKKYYSVVNGEKIQEASNSTNNGYVAKRNGKVADIIGSFPGFRVLTQAEAEYLLLSRETGVTITVNNNTVENARFAKTRVNGISVLMLFPDGMKFPENLASTTSNNHTFTADVNTIGSGAKWNQKNDFSLEDFRILESLGVVVIPAISRLSGTTLATSIDGTSESLYIPLSDNGSTFLDKCISISYSNVNTSTNTDAYAMPLRLVTDTK